MISITTRTRQGEKRHFTCKTETLEAGLAAVNGIAATEDILLRVHLFDKASLIALPLEAFDGQPMEQPLTILQKEWEGVLQKPIDWESVQRQRLISDNRRHLNRQAAYITRLEEAIAQTQQRVNLHPEPLIGYLDQTRSSANLWGILHQYQRQLAQAVGRRERMLNELAQLQG